MVQELPDK